MDRLHLALPGEHFAQALHPRLVRGRVHPVDPGDHRRVMHENQRRLIGRLTQPVSQPARPRFAKGAAVATILERIEADDPEPQPRLDDIVQEAAVCRSDLREGSEQPGAAVVVADHRYDRKGNVAQQIGGLGEAFRVTMVGDVARQHQHVGDIRAGQQPLQRGAETGEVQFLGLFIGGKADMNVGHLCDQHGLR